MTSRTAIFGNTTTDQPESGDKLHELYWKRAELKKEFDGLRKEKLKLQDRIKEYEGSVARVQQKLEHLESLLVDPDWVHTVVVFYQLRSLNLRCQRKLEAFAEQLKQQHEKRQHNKALVGWNEKRKQEASAIERKVGECRMQLQSLEDQIQVEEHKVNSMNGLSKMLKGRSANQSIEALQQEILVVQQRESELLYELDDIQKQAPPDQQGLDIGAKRSINFMIIAFAQQLYLHFCDDQLASLAKEASDKSVGALNYGSKEDCDVLLSRIRKRADEFEELTDFADVLRERAKMMSDKATFREQDDAVPESATVATIFQVDSTGTVREKDANLLGDNYWNLSGVLSR